jgi:hypothetical protein
MASLGVQIIACADKGSAVAIKMVSVFLHLTLQSGLVVLGTKLSLSSRWRIILGVGAIFCLFLVLYHNAMTSKGLEIHTYRLLASQEYVKY